MLTKNLKRVNWVAYKDIKGSDGRKWFVIATELTRNDYSYTEIDINYRFTTTLTFSQIFQHRSCISVRWIEKSTGMTFYSTDEMLYSAITENKIFNSELTGTFGFRKQNNRIFIQLTE